MDDLLPLDEDSARYGEGFFDNGVLRGVQAGANARFNFGGGSASTPAPAQNTPLPIESTPAANTPAPTPSTASSPVTAGEFFTGEGGGALIGGAFNLLTGLIQTGIAVDVAKKNPAAARLLQETQRLEAEKAAGGNPAEINARLEALAQQNAALIQQMQQPKSALSNPVVVVTGMLLVLGAGAALLIGLSRGGGGRRDQDPNIIDLPPGSWSY